MSNNQTQVFTGAGINLFRLASLKGQLKLESKGLKSSGGAIRPRIAAEFGLSPRASHEKYIEVIQARIDQINADAAK